MNSMEGRRVTATANDPAAAARFGGTGDYWLSWEQDNVAGGTVEVRHLGHGLNDQGRPHPPRYQWAWAVYAVWPKGMTGRPALYEWVAARDAWVVDGQEYATQRDAVTAAKALFEHRYATQAAIDAGPAPADSYR
jgi:hypothetical protein